jgi:hypothetical protein
MAEMWLRWWRVIVAAAARCVMRATLAAGTGAQGSGTAGVAAGDPHPAAITITPAASPVTSTDAVVRDD